MNSRAALVCALFASCTFGGSDEDPTNGYGAVTVRVDGGEPSTAEDDGSTPRGNLDASAMVDARPSGDGTPSDGGALGGGGAGDGGGRADGGSTRDGGSSSTCKPNKLMAVCDPVANTGCNPFQQCDLDPDGMSQAGRCVFWTLGLGGCSANALSVSCDPKNTCIDGTCKPLCYCDSDCPSGKKCTGTAPGPEGAVKVCQ